MLQNSAETLVSGGAGYGMGGGLGSIGLFGLLGLRGIGGLGGDGEVGMTGFQAGLAAGENGKFRDIAAAQNAISSQITSTSEDLAGTIVAGNNNLQSSIAGVKDQATSFAFGLQSSLCELGSKVDRNNYDQLMQTKDLTSALFATEARLTAQATANQSETNMNFKNAEVRDLTTQLNEVQRQRDLLATGNFPIAQIATLVRQDPCAHAHASEQINIVNQNTAAIGSQVNQLAPVLQAILNKLDSLGK